MNKVIWIITSIYQYILAFQSALITFSLNHEWILWLVIISKKIWPIIKWSFFFILALLKIIGIIRKIVGLSLSFWMLSIALISQPLGVEFMIFNLIILKQTMILFIISSLYIELSYSIKVQHPILWKRVCYIIVYILNSVIMSYATLEVLRTLFKSPELCFKHLFIVGKIASLLFIAQNRHKLIKQFKRNRNEKSLNPIRID